MSTNQASPNPLTAKASPAQASAHGGDDRPPWVPIRRLGDDDRATVLDHLLNLDSRARYLRFGYSATDEQIGRYTAHLNFSHDELFGIFDRKLRLLATAHLAYIDQTSAGEQRVAEFGVSVAAAARRHGYGARLYEHAVLHARNRNIESLLIHALSENTPMLKIARNAGATVVRDHGEAQALLRLPPQTLASNVEQMVEDGVAAIDYRLKQQAHRVDQFLSPSGSSAKADAE